MFTMKIFIVVFAVIAFLSESTLSLEQGSRHLRKPASNNVDNSIDNNQGGLRKARNLESASRSSSAIRRNKTAAKKMTAVREALAATDLADKVFDSALILFSGTNNPAAASRLVTANRKLNVANRGLFDSTNGLISAYPNAVKAANAARAISAANAARAISTVKAVKAVRDPMTNIDSAVRAAAATSKQFANALTYFAQNNSDKAIVQIAITNENLFAANENLFSVTNKAITTAMKAAKPTAAAKKTEPAADNKPTDAAATKQDAKPQFAVATAAKKNDP